MGRTRRKRRKREKIRSNQCLDNEEIVINLRKFMYGNGWVNDTNLKLYNFVKTNRGVASTKSLPANSTLITIPYDLMVTFTTIQSLGIIDFLKSSAKLTIHDFLSLFLIVEKQKKSNSKWWFYIESLPSRPPPLLWHLPLEQIKQLPVELGLNTLKARRLFEESWNRVRGSIQKGSIACLLDMDLFLWAYSMVNTRAVYVDPCIVRKLCIVKTIDSVLSDEPSMALCPYLDMFNHSHETSTNAEFIQTDQQWFYRLISLEKNRKYRQIFISYGHHDNCKLLIEYGFFIPGNRYDSINFTKDEILGSLELNLNNFQYKFIVEHKLDDGSLLYVNKSGISFNLKAFLFVCYYSEERKFASIIYSNSYPEEFEEIVANYCKILLNSKIVSTENTLTTLKMVENCSEILSLVCEFLSYWKRFIESLLMIL